MRDIAHPHETLLVADSLTGQDAVKLATSFNERIGITGIVLTRVDGDGRGGAALSMRAVTGKPIKLLGVGEKWDALEDFHPQRIAGRILGMGDVVSLVEKAAQNIDMQKAQAIAEKMRKGVFDLEDLSDQLKQMEKIGGMSGMMGMLPGIGKVKKQMDAANFDDSIFKRQRAIISSMTPKERRSPKILDGKRKRRIAAGSGTKPEDINKLLKMHRQMADMMKTMGKRGGLMQRMMGGGAGAPSPADMERMQAELGRLDPKALENLPKDMKEQLPKGLPGLGGGAMPKFPGLPGLGGGAPRFPGLPGYRARRNDARGQVRTRCQRPLLPEPSYLKPETDDQKGTEDHVRENPPLAWGHQEAALLLHRRGRGGLAARRPLHRADRHAQSAAAQGQCRPREARSRARQALAGRRRAAVRSRLALPRCGGPDEARGAQQPGEVQAEEEAPGARGGSRRSSDEG